MGVPIKSIMATENNIYGNEIIYQLVSLNVQKSNFMLTFNPQSTMFQL